MGKERCLLLNYQPFFKHEANFYDGMSFLPRLAAFCKQWQSTIFPDKVFCKTNAKSLEGRVPRPAIKDFISSNWAFIYPLFNVHCSLPKIPKSAISWLRIYLWFDSAVIKQRLALIIEQFIVSKIYLNDLLTVKFGKLSAT